MSDPTNSPDSPHDPSNDDRTVRQRRADSGLLGGRTWAAVAAVAVGVIAAVVILSLNNGSGDDDADASGAVDIVSEKTTDADTGTEAAEEADADAGSSKAWQVSTTGAFEIALTPTDSGVGAITVHDPATPTLAGNQSQQCVLVTLAGPATVETYGCAPIGTTEAVTLPLSEPGAPLVGCAAVTTREEPGEPTATDATTDFVVTGGDSLPAGDYDVTVAAVTGYGDGCAPTDGTTEHEASAEATIPVG